MALSALGANRGQAQDFTEAFQPSLHYGFRSYPLGTSLDIRLAQALKLWGEPQEGPLYGFLRPSVEWSTAVTYNALSAQVEFFPLSFFGLRSGLQAVDNRSDYTAYDCNLHLCKGRFHKDFAEIQLALAYAQFFVLAQFRQESLNWTGPESAQRFVDPEHALSMEPKGEAVFRQSLILGVNLSPSLRVMLLDRKSMIKADRGIQAKTQLALISRQRGPWTLTSGLGSFVGELNKKNISFIFGASYSPNWGGEL